MPVSVLLILSLILMQLVVMNIATFLATGVLARFSALLEPRFLAAARTEQVLQTGEVLVEAIQLMILHGLVLPDT